MLTKISHTEKDKYHMISLMCGTWKTKQNKTKDKQKIETSSVDTEIKFVVARGEKSRGMEEISEGD